MCGDRCRGSIGKQSKGVDHGRQADGEDHSGKGRRRVTFAFRAKSGSKVYLGGTFNDWNYLKKPLKEGKERGIFSAVCMLAPGTYEDKFYANGRWCLDPGNPRFCGNNFGSLNSVMVVV